MGLIIHYQVETHASNLPTPKDLDAWAESIAHLLPDSAEMSIRFVDEAEMSEYNQNFRGKIGPTNVLSFPHEEDELDEERQYLGDIAICSPVVEKEAVEQDKQLSHHYAHLTIHGLLHLIGYDHITENDAIKMEALEVKALEKLGIPNPF